MKRKFEDGALIEHNLGDGRTRRRTDGEISACDLYGCRVLVSKERLEQKWPTEADGPEGEAFRKFAARLADAVQKALAEGVTIIDRKDEGCRCPLGTLTEATHPDAFDCSRAGVLDQVRAVLFYSGFDQRWVSDSEKDSPYYRLGQAYRARFVRP